MHGRIGRRVELDNFHFRATIHHIRMFINTRNWKGTFDEFSLSRISPKLLIKLFQWFPAWAWSRWFSSRFANANHNGVLFVGAAIHFLFLRSKIELKSIGVERCDLPDQMASISKRCATFYFAYDDASPAAISSQCVRAHRIEFKKFCCRKSLLWIENTNKKSHFSSF